MAAERLGGVERPEPPLPRGREVDLCTVRVDTWRELVRRMEEEVCELERKLKKRNQGAVERTTGLKLRQSKLRLPRTGRRPSAKLETQLRGFKFLEEAQTLQEARAEASAWRKAAPTPAGTRLHDPRPQGAPEAVGRPHEVQPPDSQDSQSGSEGGGCPGQSGPGRRPRSGLEQVLQGDALSSLRSERMDKILEHCDLSSKAPFVFLEA